MLASCLASLIMKLASIFCVATVARAQLPDDNDRVNSTAETEQQNVTDVAGGNSTLATEDRAAWCRDEYVDQKECAKWIADQMGDFVNVTVTEDEAEQCHDEHVDPWQCAKWQAQRKPQPKADDLAPQQAGPSILAEAVDGNTTADAAGSSVTEDQAEWCRREYVDEKDCAKWVANQMGDMANVPVSEDQAERCRREHVDPWQCAKWAAQWNAAHAEREAQREPVQQLPSQQALSSVLSLAETGDDSAISADEAQRQAARTADEVQRKALREKDEVARKADEVARAAAREADEKARKEARAADEAAREAARKADETILGAARKADDEKREQAAAQQSSAGPELLAQAPPKVLGMTLAPGSLVSAFAWCISACAAAAVVRHVGSRGRRTGTERPLLEDIAVV